MKIYGLTHAAAVDPSRLVDLQVFTGLGLTRVATDCMDFLIATDLLRDLDRP